MVALVFLLLLDLPVSAERTCLECLNASQEELIHCLHNAISEEDTLACDERQHEQATSCEDDECKVEREEREKRTELPLTRTGQGLVGASLPRPRCTDVPFFC